jgi:MHS family proline/betaine transporter-like MFS transporter
MAIFSSLSRQQKEAVGLLQIGTFLEYFDLMLYVHMAVLLNELFFPKTDPHTASLLAAFAFCSTYALRPFGALIFGWVGDNIGRKATVIMTTMMMSISCVIMANLPTYAEIGISAAWVVTLCRILQGLSSIGEIIGAEIYVTEITKPPVRYSAVGFIACSSAIGSVVALAIASLVTTSGLNWRIAFWTGAGIAVVGSIARVRLRETKDFLDAKQRKKNSEGVAHFKLEKIDTLLKNTNHKWKETINKKTTIAYFLLSCAWPVCFFFSYIYCGNILKNTFGYTTAQIINQNLILAITEFVSFLFLSFLVYRIHPLIILKTKFFIFFPFVLCLPWILDHISNPNVLLLIQLFSVLFMITDVPAGGVIYTHFPVLKRFTYTSFLHAISRSLAYILTAFGLIYLTEGIGHYGLLIIMVPTCISFYWGVNHFEKLENQKHHQVHTPHPLSIKPDELKAAGSKN